MAFATCGPSCASDDCRMKSGDIFVIRNGLRWRDAPDEYGPHKTMHNRLPTYRRTKGGLTSKLHAVLRWPRPTVGPVVSEGQMSDCWTLKLLSQFLVLFSAILARRQPGFLCEEAREIGRIIETKIIGDLLDFG